MSTSPVIQRIGVLTGGGDCPGLNAVIRAVTKTAIFKYGLQVFGISDGFLGLIEGRMHVLAADDVSNILTVGGTILGTSNKADPTRYATGRDAAGELIFQDMTDQVLENAAKHQLDAVMCIGGDGTMTGAAHLSGRGLRCIGLPKTIDNDLMHCEMTFGFQTAVSIATEALDRIHTTASSHHRVMLVEMMGRNAGWLTLEAAVASGADVILIPEIPFDVEAVCEYCIRRSRRGKAFTIVAVSEGAKPLGGEQVVTRVVKDSPDPIRLGGVSEMLADQIMARTGLEARATILGHVQRGGSPVAADRVLGTLFGCKAVELLMAGCSGEVVVMQNGQVTSIPLADVAGRQRLVPLDHPLIAGARATGATFGEPK
jgi:ATP-dependent phosphofructokinase / diphosphate-dependent phosphofructokinase